MPPVGEHTLVLSYQLLKQSYLAGDLGLFGELFEVLIQFGLDHGGGYESQLVLGAAAALDENGLSEEGRNLLPEAVGLRSLDADEH